MKKHFIRIPDKASCLYCIGTLEQRIYGPYKSGFMAFWHRCPKCRLWYKTPSDELKFIWAGMIARCTNSYHPSWHNYGGRGITVSEGWLASFEQFRADMGHRPSLTYSLERIDNDKGYEKSNCKWATRREQARNKRATNK